MSASIEFHRAVEDSCLPGCGAVSRLCFRRFEGSCCVHPVVSYGAEAGTLTKKE